MQHPHAAGIDVGSRSHWACVGFSSEPGSCLIREFPAHTDGLKAIAAFLREHQVTSVAMESTGIYWVPLYELLACRLRAYLRQRAELVRSASRHAQHAQKALEQMNLKLTEVLSDVTGPTGRSIIRAILRGTRDPVKLAKYRDRGCKASEAQIARALTGSYREEHLFELKLAHEAWQFTLKQVEKVDGQIALQPGRMKGDRALPPLTLKRRQSRKINAPRFDVRAALYLAGLPHYEVLT